MIRLVEVEDAKVLCNLLEQLGYSSELDQIEEIVSHNSENSPSTIYVQESLYNLANRDGISIDQFISTAIAEKLSALMTENHLIEREKRGDRTKYKAILSKSDRI